MAPRQALSTLLPGDQPLAVVDAGRVGRANVAGLSVSLDLHGEAVDDERAILALLAAITDQLVAWDRGGYRPDRPGGGPMGALTPPPGGAAAPGEPVPRSTGARGHTGGADRPDGGEGEGDGPTAVSSPADGRAAALLERHALEITDLLEGLAESGGPRDLVLGLEELLVGASSLRHRLQLGTLGGR